MSWCRCHWTTKWLMKPGFDLVLLTGDECSSLSPHCTTAPVGSPMSQQSSGRATAANPLASPALRGWNATQARPRWCWFENGDWPKARVFFPLLCTCATPVWWLLSGCWVSPDNQMPDDAPFTLLGSIFFKVKAWLLYYICYHFRWD